MVSQQEKDSVIVGVDIGSTTAKIVVVQDGEVIYDCYERHFSQVRQKTLEIVKRISHLLQNKSIQIAISGSAGLGLARACDIPFIQEVFATGETVKLTEPDVSVVIELGGEDAKVIFFKGGVDERMNGSCAGGTGAFIDQMATLMNITVDELDALSLKHTKIYPIASRCGVFAKTDIQPLLNQGASKEDISASIYYAVVNQTIAGLAQGRKIDGKVVFLGGPLSFNIGLRRAFQDVLKLSDENAVFPVYGKLAVAIGAALYAAKQSKTFDYEELVSKLEASTCEKSDTVHLSALFSDQEDYERFKKRHEKATAPYVDPHTYSGKAYLGIDCGSTTTKMVLLSENREILYSYYDSNKGNPIPVVCDQLKKIYEICEDHISICSSAVTGYGEELIKHAFHIDRGIVETLAHFTAAKHFNPNVDFILDIGGQDIKCFKIRGGAIDSIMLNEACSSGCGSFLETFSRSMHYDISDFSKMGLFTKAPVDLGSRCTVFMNSSVKQAQKDGATVEEISSGLSMSVVKNALYKVIRANSAADLGENIVVQGGTFLNDAVLRAFEMEIGHDVIRPQIAGLMGAFGAALYAQEQSTGHSGLLSPEALSSFEHKTNAVTCNGCTNHCRLTINTFSGGEKYISGNKCEKGAGIKMDADKVLPNLYEYKRKKFEELLQDNQEPKESNRGTIGLPLALGMYELAPFWKAIFEHLGYRVILSGFSSRKLYAKGQYSIPSDTACYPAKIMHGHIETLLEKKVDAIFYPCLTYNFDEKTSQNHYNCPVVAYYSELLSHNMDDIHQTAFLYPYLNINDKKQLAKELGACLSENLGAHFSHRELLSAIDFGYSTYENWMEDIRQEGKRAIRFAHEKGKRVMVLAGRPYHIDPEISHGIDKLAANLGFVVVSEDAVAGMTDSAVVDVLNQWTYHARLYNAAKYACEHSDTQFVQLVSFGCGLDAITTDEIRAILESSGKLYTQIKIDEITNLGAVNIRLRSLLGAIEQKNGLQNQK
jgi:predicted CoA-substrate-specific enzyme activase